MNTSKSKQKKRTIISLMLIGAILIGGAFAFLTAQDSKTNVFTIGKIDIELWEKFDTNTNGTIDDGETYDASTKTPPTIENIIPGQSILKEPYVVNKSNTPSRLYMTVEIPALTTAEAYVENEGDAYTLDGEKKIEVKAYAIQDGYSDKTDATDIWNAYFEKNITSFGEADTEGNKVQMFALKGLDTTNWELLSTNAIKKTDENSVVSYSNVFTYVYKGTAATVDGATTYDYLLPGNQTSSSLFTSVELNALLGGRNPNVTLTEGLSVIGAYTDESNVKKGYVIGYGFTMNVETLSESFTGDGIKVTATKAASRRYYGTGSTVKVYVNEILEYEYTVVIWGDINRDGIVNATDINLIEASLIGEYTLTTAEKIAADLYRDYTIDIFNDKNYVPNITITQEDVDLLEAVIAGQKEIIQADGTIADV